MYSESDIDGAVTAGVLTPAAATAFRAHVAALRQSPAVDEEQFRLLTGFNDIFVSIAILLLLVAVSWIGVAIAPSVGAILVAATSWGLAEYFTRQRRMALPSIVLLIAFLTGIALALWLLSIGDDSARVERLGANGNEQAMVLSLTAAMVSALTAFAAWLHWRRFMVPITVAASAVAIVGIVMSVVLGIMPALRSAVFPLVLVAGLAMFAFAMRWDISDRARVTRRSDVAFWLHLAAAPMIAHALFNLLGVFDGTMTVGRAVMVLALYIGFALVALAIDRRALLVSSLVYVLYALSALFKQAGAVELSAAFTAFIIGSALLLLSAFWHPMRRRVVALAGPRLAGSVPPV
jgi:uncharacterized membrane protein YfcA